MAMSAGRPFSDSVRFCTAARLGRCGPLRGSVVPVRRLSMVLAANDLVLCSVLLVVVVSRAQVGSRMAVRVFPRLRTSAGWIGMARLLIFSPRRRRIWRPLSKAGGRLLPTGSMIALAYPLIATVFPCMPGLVGAGVALGTLCRGHPMRRRRAVPCPFSLGRVWRRTPGQSVVSRRMTTRGVGRWLVPPRRLAVNVRTAMVLPSWVAGRRVVARGAVAFSTWRAPVREELLSVGRLAAVQWLGVIAGPMRADRAGPSPPPRLVCRSLGFPLVGSIGWRASGSHIAQLACVRRFVES